MTSTQHTQSLTDFRQKRDAAVIRQAIGGLEKGQGQEAHAFFDDVRAQLLDMKSKRMKGTRK